MKFCFPERDPETIEDNERNDEQADVKKAKGGKKNRDSNFYVNIERPPIDDVEKMKVVTLFLCSSNFFCNCFV